MQSALRAALLNELVDELTNPLSALTDQNFGIGLLTDELNSRPRYQHTALSLPLAAGYVRPWRISPAQQSGVSNIHHDKAAFKVCSLFQINVTRRIDREQAVCLFVEKARPCQKNLRL